MNDIFLSAIMILEKEVPNWISLHWYLMLGVEAACWGWSRWCNVIIWQNIREIVQTLTVSWSRDLEICLIISAAGACGLCGLQHNMNTKNNKLGIAVVTMNIVLAYIELTYCTKLHCNQLLAAGVPSPHQIIQSMPPWFLGHPTQLKQWGKNVFGCKYVRQIVVLISVLYPPLVSTLHKPQRCCRM